MVRWLREQKKLDISVESRVRVELVTMSSYYNFVQTWKDTEFMLLHTKVDLVVTLGGDGTVLWAASMFKGPVPPVVPFSLGSLGFMTPFHSERYQGYLDSLLKGVPLVSRYGTGCSAMLLEKQLKMSMKLKEHLAFPVGNLLVLVINRDFRTRR